MDFAERSTNFATLIRSDVRQQFPDVHAFSEYPGFFVFRRGSRVAQMVIGADDTVTLHYLYSGESGMDPEMFSLADGSVEAIAASIIEWLNFGRHRERGT